MLGDVFAKEEFRRHRTADKETQQHFLQTWQAYIQQIESQVQQQTEVGTSLASDVVEELPDDRVLQLALLRDEIRQPGSVVGDALPSGTNPSKSRHAKQPAKK